MGSVGVMQGSDKTLVVTWSQIGKGYFMKLRVCDKGNSAFFQDYQPRSKQIRELVVVSLSYTPWN